MKKENRSNYAIPAFAGMYTDLIEETLDGLKRGEVDASEVEGWMRQKFGALDNLDRATFKREVKSALYTFDAFGSAGF